MPAYIPPALRNRQHEAENNKAAADQATATELPSKPLLPTLKDIRNHFWPTELVAPEDQDCPAPMSVKGHRKYGSSTLNGSEEDPDKLKYVILFPKANPTWSEKKIIFAKTDLHLVTETDRNGSLKPLAADQIGPILVFEKAKFNIGHDHAGFDTQGYYKINNVTIYKPWSASLEEMLDRKWTFISSRGNEQKIVRKMGAWKESLRYWWAEISFEEDEVANMPQSLPKIDATRPIKERKSVNESLKEMRQPNDGTMLE